MDKIKRIKMFAEYTWHTAKSENEENPPCEEMHAEEGYTNYVNMLE